ncbi:NAD(P)H-dependent oxidoreductase [Kitasatospora sp. McL0602]|uniref:NAD(P)H-dependent oxidoreductase n=1 Tax=Kitasatospora sp. McL0602 TaxID=3439530 RepID=UPI003F8A559B
MRTLVLLAHPSYAGSRGNRTLTEAVRDLPDVTVHDLYATYPDQRLDVGREQRLAEEHDRIVLQFPLYWFSTPGLLKQWQDEVILHGWGYGPGGEALQGKTLQVVVTTGGGSEHYGPEGKNLRTVGELLVPLATMAAFTGMEYAEPLVVHAVELSSDEDLALAAKQYRELLGARRV